MNTEQSYFATSLGGFEVGGPDQILRFETDKTETVQARRR